uniref:Uncharacterized protein n=1 Tax=Panagrolaimus sp. PS1159 TaxID=55785 RepID=A0AC35GLR7_9BILA
MQCWKMNKLVQKVQKLKDCALRGDVTPANQSRYLFLDYRFMPKCFHTKSEYTIFDETESFIYVFYDIWTQY